MATLSTDQFHYLNEAFARLYPTVEDSRRVADAAELDTLNIEFHRQALVNWFHILKYAQNNQQIDDLINEALKKYPKNEILLNAKQGIFPERLKAPDISDWNGPEDKSTLEKIIGETSTLVHVRYLEQGVDRARSVVRVVMSEGLGSGFITDGNLLITNNHVIATAAQAKNAVVQFNYQKTVDGKDAKLEEFKLNPDDYFKTSVEDDWTAVRLDGNAECTWGAISLQRKDVQEGSHVNIIQHPGGDQKQISISGNKVAFSGNGRVQYLTDTLPGSSGSPVFDENWDVVALHHSGGWLMEPNAADKKIYYRNEGISIDKIIDGLA